MSSNLIIGVDTGNRCIKTINHSFVAGLKKSKYEPIVADVLKFNGDYYMLSQQRIPYLQDKTFTDEYFVLTLFAIAMELKQRKVDLSKTIPITLGVGLPPSHIPLYKDKFKNYFKRGIVEFEYSKEKIMIDIQNVMVFSQGYAAIFMDYDAISKFEKSYIIDIGGYTTDVIALTNGRIDPDFCESLDKGLIHLFNNVQMATHKKYGHRPTESQIDSLMVTGREMSADMPVTEILNSEIDMFLDDIMRKLLEYGIDLKFSKGIFVGGGSERLKKWIEKSNFVTEPYFIMNVFANAQGYEAILQSLSNRS